MPFSYQIDPARPLVHCTARGVLTLDELKSMHQQLEADPAFKTESRLLWDFHEATRFDHSIAKFVETAETAFAGTGRRRALVAPVPDEVRKLLHIWILHREARGDRDVRLFGSIDAARLWLAT